MEFSFDVNSLFPQIITRTVGGKLSQNKHKFINHDAEDKFSEVVNRMGVASAKAQGLREPITTIQRLQASNQVLYLMKENNKSGKGVAIGIIKVGPKKLFLNDPYGVQHEVEPLCVLDFYVHESKQRTGCGKKLFEGMLKAEGVKPFEVAIDRPSSKFLGFLKKHYKLQSYVRQANNYVVFDQFFSTCVDVNRKRLSFHSNGTTSSPMRAVHQKRNTVHVAAKPENTSLALGSPVKTSKLASVETPSPISTKPQHSRSKPENCSPVTTTKSTCTNPASPAQPSNAVSTAESHDEHKAEAQTKSTEKTSTTESPLAANLNTKVSNTAGTTIMSGKISLGKDHVHRTNAKENFNWSPDCVGRSRRALQHPTSEAAGALIPRRGEFNIITGLPSGSVVLTDKTASRECGSGTNATSRAPFLNMRQPQNSRGFRFGAGDSNTSLGQQHPMRYGPPKLTTTSTTSVAHQLEQNVQGRQMSTGNIPMKYSRHASSGGIEGTATQLQSVDKHVQGVLSLSNRGSMPHLTGGKQNAIPGSLSSRYASAHLTKNNIKDNWKSFIS